MGCEPVVTIQRRSAADLIEGHLSWGVLIDRDRVLVPAPLDWLQDPDIDFEVLLASARQGGRGLVERIAVTRADVRGVKDGEEQAFAILTLAYESRHTAVRGTAYDPETLTSRLADSPDVWTALEEVGEVPPGVRDYPVAQVLEPVMRWEAIKRREIVRYRLEPSPDDASLNWCCLFHICTRCHECPGHWW
jgi:hypothetical protein